MMSRRSLAGLALAAATLAALGCTPASTSVSVTLTAAPDLNGGLPAKATIFYLASTSAFSAADYATLATNPQAALGADLLGTQSVLLSPGGTGTTGRSFEGEGPVAVGVIVGFKAIDRAQWRAVAPVAQGRANMLNVSVGAASVSISRK